MLSFRQTVIPPPYVKQVISTMLWGTFSWAALRPLVVLEQTMKAADYLNIIVDQLHPYMVSVFPNGIFQHDNASCHKARIVLKEFQELYYEFQLMSWPPNTLDLNLIQHIWVFIEKQLKDQTPPCQNISTLCESCLNMIQPVSSYLPRSCGIHVKISCSYFTGKRWLNALLSRWS